MLDVMKVQKKPKQRRSLSIASLGGASEGSSTGDLLALYDVPTQSSGSGHESCMGSVEALESSFAELRALNVEVEAQTWSGRKPG